MDLGEEDEDKVKNIIWEFGYVEIFPIRNGSFATREDLFEFKIWLSNISLDVKSFNFFLDCNICNRVSEWVRTLLKSHSGAKC